MGRGSSRNLSPLALFCGYMAQPLCAEAIWFKGFSPVPDTGRSQPERGTPPHWG